VHHRGRRRGPAGQGPRPAHRALCHHPREGHRPGPRHRQADPRGPWRPAAADRRRRAWRRPGVPDLPAQSRPAGGADRRRARPDARPYSGVINMRAATGADILGVDDEADIRELVSGILQAEGHAVRVAADSDAALAAIRDRKPSLLVLDIWMQGGGLDGLELLDLVKELDPDLPVVMISGHGNIETAVSALKRGAYDFLEKP